MNSKPSRQTRPYIVCAANKHGEMIITGARHFDNIMSKVIKAIWPVQEERQKVCGEMEQGFIDQWGNFYTREEAMHLIINTGQSFDVRSNGGTRTALYSEGLY